MHLSAVASIILFTSMITMVTSVSTNQKPPTSVFGVCNHIGTFNIPQVKVKNNWTKVHWHVGKGYVVVKFKVGLTNLCKNMAKVMDKVQGDLRRMMFWRKRVPVVHTKIQKH